MKSENLHPNTHFSIFDTIEQLTATSHQFLSKCEKKLSKPLGKIFHQWEKAFSMILNDRQSKEQELSEVKEKLCASKNTELKLRIKLTHKKSKEAEMLREIQAIKEHLEEGKEMWAKQIKRIEEVMQEQERSKQRIESLYRQRLTEIDKELDDIMHIHKKKLELSQNLGDILPGLFSMEELIEEKRIALGEISKRELREVKILKLEGCSGEDIADDDSVPEMNFEDLTGTQKQIFERLLELRKKVYKFKHDDTTCSEGSSMASLPLELKSMTEKSFKVEQKLSRTVDKGDQVDHSVLFCRSAGVIFGFSGSLKYRKGMTELLGSGKLSVTEREKIVYDLINEQISEKKGTVQQTDVIKQEDWGDVSSIHAGNNEAEVSQDLQSMFSKGSLNLSKVSLVHEKNESIQVTESIAELNDLFNKEKEEKEEEEDLKEELKDEEEEEEGKRESTCKEVEISKEQEQSSMSILKDFSRVSEVSKRKLSEESKKGRFLEFEEVMSSRRKFSVDQREPDGDFIIPPHMNLYFVPDSGNRPRSNPRVSLKPEGPSGAAPPGRSRESSFDSVGSSNKSRVLSEGGKKPISMLNKLPILPKPPSEAKKTNLKTFRGRSLQPVQPKPGSSPPGKKVPLEIKSMSPGSALKFRMRRFKEGHPATTKAKGVKSLLPKRTHK